MELLMSQFYGKLDQSLIDNAKSYELISTKLIFNEEEIQVSDDNNYGNLFVSDW